MSAPRPIPEALLERYLAGELDEPQRAAVEQQLAASPADKARLAALRADSAAYLVKHPPGPTVAKLEGVKAPSRGWTWLVAPLAAALASVAFFLWLPGAEPESSLKGDVALAVYRQTSAGAERLESGASLAPGDKVRFEVRAAKDGWVAVLSKDAKGEVTAYYPYQGTKAAPYRTAEPLLPGAIGLDETRGAEEVWALYSREPFELAAHLEALKKGQPFSGVASARVGWTKR